MISSGSTTMSAPDALERAQHELAVRRQIADLRGEPAGTPPGSYRVGGDLVLEAADAPELRAGELALAQLEPAREPGERVVDDHEQEPDEDEDVQDRRLDDGEEVRGGDDPARVASPR